MREPRSYLPRDLQALYYLNALEARDLETVASLWDEASRDPELESLLVAVDRTLFADHSANSNDTGSVSLRHEPAGLSDPQRPGKRRWAIWIGVGGAVAAACLLAVLARPVRNGNDPVRSGKENDIVKVTPDAPDNSARNLVPRQKWRIPDEEDGPRFQWPLPQASRVSALTSFSPDPLD
jgi:hypothetical protein